MKIAYQGVRGAFSHEACLAFRTDHEAVGKQTFAAVLTAVADRDAELGMLPFENSTAGPVEEVHALLSKGAFPILARHRLPIRLHLMGLPGAELDEITTAVSHPMALKQCSETLGRLGLAAQPASNTAVAAQSLSDPTHAVLASEAAAAAYGLQILRRDMQDRSDNSTLFVVIGPPER